MRTTAMSWRRRRVGAWASALVTGACLGQFGTCGITDVQARDFFASTGIRVGLQAISTFLQTTFISTINEN